MTDNPILDYDQYDAQLEAYAESRPKCHICEEPIYDESAIHFYDYWICDECAEHLRERIGD